MGSKNCLMYIRAMRHFMETFRWNFEVFLIIALRNPKYYHITLSGIFAGIFSSLKISEPIKKMFDTIPYLVGSDWIYSTTFAAIFWILLYLISWLSSSFFGVQPFEFIANNIESLKGSPDFTSYIESRLKSNSTYSVSGDYRVRIVQNDNDLSKFNQINRELFSFTAFALPIQVIKNRNKTLFQANKLTAALVEAQINQSDYIPIGISHIIPLNDLGKALYVKNDGLKDGEIRAEHIANSEEWSNAILLFSMGILPPYRKMVRDKSLTLVFVFLEHLIKVIAEMQISNPKEPYTYIYVQTEKPNKGIGKIISRVGFQKLDILSGDGYPLWEKRLGTSQSVSDKNILKFIEDKLNNWFRRLGKKN